VARAEPAGGAAYRLLVSRLIEALVSQVNLLVSRREQRWWRSLARLLVAQAKLAGVFTQQTLSATPAWPYAMRHQRTLSATPSHPHFLFRCSAVQPSLAVLAVLVIAD